MGIYEYYDYYWYQQADPRVKEWFLMGSIFPVILVTFSYLYAVMVCCPRYMKNRPAYVLKNYTRCYNVFQVVANYLLVKKLIEAGWFTKIPFTCIPTDYNTDTLSLQLLNLMWWNTIIKITDLSETIVFALRKKDRQISFLHLYHHISTLLLQWIGMRYIGSVMSTFLILINSSVHVIMYSYYFLSTFPTTQKIVVRFKHIITIIQMVQFCIFVVYITQGFAPSCDVPKIAVVIGMINVMVNFFLFYNFYRTNYVKPKET